MLLPHKWNWSRFKRVAVLVIVFILINAVFYNVYIHGGPTVFTSRLTYVNVSFNGSCTGHFSHSKNECLEGLSEKQGIPRTHWMDQPIVNPFPYAFVLNPKNGCAKKSVELFIGVPVARANFDKRQTIRETWGSYSQVPANNAVLLFFVGNGSETESPDIQAKINEESKLHADIVQCEFSDTYRNLSLKSMSILRWMDAHCPNATFLTKADDDMYVHVPKLVERLRQTRHNNLGKPFIIGSRIIGAKPVQNKQSKWYTPLTRFPERKYPTYESGTSYSMTGNTSRLLYQAALRTPLFWLEDIYITGLCAKMANVSIIDDRSHTYAKPKARGCSFRTYITGHRYSMAEIRNIHREISDKKLKCP